MFGQAWRWLLAAGIVIVGAGRAVVACVAAGFVVLGVVDSSPTLIVPILTEVAAERRMYLPLAALVAVGGWRLLAGSIRSVARAARRTLHQRTRPPSDNDGVDHRLRCRLGGGDEAWLAPDELRLIKILSRYGRQNLGVQPNDLLGEGTIWAGI